ncbi:MAG TPA: hypothetical protein VLT89_16665 [Usitatibacter sp.]|nr:hypothetical protein [Usitatibacter sp.]
MKALAALAVALVAIAIVVAAYRADPDKTIEAREAREAKKAQESKFSSPSVVLSINAGKASPFTAPPSNPRASPLAAEFDKARALKPLYDRLMAPGGAATGDAKFILYKILSTCVPEAAGVSAADLQQARAKRRQQLEAQIPQASQDRAKRLAMYDQMMSGERCAGFESVTATKDDIDKLLKDAAAEGDPKARARLATRELDASFVPPAPGKPANFNGPALTDTQLQTFRDAIASRDPEAIVIAGTALSVTFRDAVIEVGPTHEELQSRASMEAWRMVACEYGLDCGPESRTLQEACAYQGYCAATTVPDLVYFYGVSPYEAQLIDQYRQVFRNAAANNDWSGLEVARRANTSGNRFYFSSSP